MTKKIKYSSMSFDEHKFMLLFLFCFVFQAEELAIKKAKLSLEELAARQRSLGNIRFIGELFKLKVLLM